MKYAARYCKGQWSNFKADEIIIKYTDRNIQDLQEFCKDHQKQRIILNVVEWEDQNYQPEDCVDIFKVLREVCDLAVMTTIYSGNSYNVFKANNIPFFFEEGAGTLDLLNFYLDAGVSDVRVINELGFSLDKISELCHANDVKVRCFPNVAQSSASLYTNKDKIKDFWIRPEDVIIYKDYIDVLEFWGDLEKQDIYYKIYKDGVFPDDLSELILELNRTIKSDTIVPTFGLYRSKCEKRCYKGGVCGICDRVVQLADKMLEEGYEIPRVIQKKELSDEEKKKLYEDYKQLQEEKGLQKNHTENEIN